MSPKTPGPTVAELEIMRVVWQRGDVTVRDVYEAIREQRRVAYTTVLTVMKVLEQKGHLKRRTDGRAHVYRAAKPERLVVRSLVRDFVERVFGGAAQPLLVHLIEDRRLSAREMRELARLARSEEEE